MLQLDDNALQQSGSPTRHATSQGGVALQLFLSHLLAGGFVLIVCFSVHQISFLHPYSFFIALAGAGVVGVLATSNVQYSLYLLEVTLGQLSRNQQTLTNSSDDTRKTFVRRWPLGPLFLRLDATDRRMQRYTKHEFLTNELREKALQQASEAAAQDERNRIARDLHDSIKQQIFSISVSAAAAKALWQGEDSRDAKEAVEDIQRSAKEAQVEMQALLQQLRPAPLENASLVEALNVQAQALGFRTGAQVHVQIGELPGNDRLLPGTQETIFRLIQEAFANIARHARAQTVWLKLSLKGQTLSIEVHDDGRGFDSTQTHQGMGLNNLRERTQEINGTLEITSQPGLGTRIIITIPLLDMLSHPEEVAHQHYELARASELSNRGYQLCTNMSLIGMALAGMAIVLDLPWSIVILVGLIAIYGYSSGLYYRIQVTFNPVAEKRQILVSKRQQYRSGLSLMRFFGICAWYGLTLAGILKTGPGWWILGAIISILVGIIQITRRRYYLDTEHYYQLLSIQELQWELERHRQTITRSIIVWFSIGISGLLLNYRLFLFPIMTIAQKTAYGLAFILLILGIGLFFEYQQTQRWYWTLIQSKAHMEG
ncbi:sensor histidine kinase [Tengunoibacter tsumagoiensis]|uniref:Oxygen sensor histidine kinase NreB n=1 Tax=Tengunoibacter tsumagoiensis TaxID=2014871 RepID=A0A401ZTJ3_9CHLR|nr:sensor histidine kinase [Tengunoibacter tsumagoiensis]GCE10187.1 hypothetical protein KTT_00460 [Tengunoibacter tsumagoiensis]